MSDRFLQDHCIAARTYRVCAPLAPASIRDMSIRAEQLVLRLRDASVNGPPMRHVPLIGPSTRVLVVGAGVAGMVCAASLLKYTNCRSVTLNEVSDQQLQTQIGNRHRYIAPHGFDWPYYFYRIARHPLVGTSVLPWRAALADDVAKQFKARFAAVTTGPEGRGRYVGAFKNAVTAWRYDPGSGWDVAFTKPPPGSKNSKQHFDLIILCCGVSSETDTLCGYRGFRFWDAYDAFLAPPVLPLQPSDTVLICGGGDGGLNDFIRLVTGEAVPERLIPRLESAIGEKFRQRYQAMQALTHRHYLIGGDPRYDQATLAYSFDMHQKLARRLFASRAMQEALSKIIRPGHPHVQLLVRHYAFGRCYTPNAMLVSLLARAIAAMAKNGQAARPPLLLATDVKRVRAADKRALPTTADEWSAHRIKVDFVPSDAFAKVPQSDEVRRMLSDGVADAGSSQRGVDFRCMFIRTGGDRKDHPAVTEVIEAIRHGTAHLPHVSEIRHALPQSPLPPY